MFSSNVSTGFNQDAIQKSQLDNNLNVPSKTDSVFEGLGRSFAEPWLGLADVDAAMTKQPGENEGAHILLNNMSAQGSQNPISFDIGSLAGFALNPVNLVSGGLGGEAGGLLADSVTGFAPNVIQKAASSVIGGGLGMEASMLPSDIADNTNPSTSSIDWGGVAKAMPANLGIGMTFGVGHFVLGAALDALQARRIAKGQAAQQADSSQEITDALNDGTIDQDQHDFMQAYNSGEDQETLNTLASKVASKSGVQSPNINVPLLKPEDLSNLQVIAGDELGADVPPELKGAISDYIVNKNIDDIRSNPVMMSTLKGFSEHMDGRLSNQDAELQSLDKAADQARREPIESNNIDQQSVYNAVKDKKATGLTIPKEVQDRLQFDQNPTDQSTPKLLKLKEELDGIRQNLSDTDNLKGLDYPRLTQIVRATDHPYAKAILKRVQQGLKYKRQEAIKSVADKILSLNENAIPRQADPSKLFDYLKARIETKTALAESVEPPKPITPENIKSQLESAQNDVPKMAKEAQIAVEKADTFKANQAKFTDLIFCLEKS